MPPLSVSESIIGEKKNVFQSNQNFIITFRLISSLNPISVSDYGATASVDNKLLIELDPGRLEQLHVSGFDSEELFEVPISSELPVSQLQLSNSLHSLSAVWIIHEWTIKSKKT